MEFIGTQDPVLQAVGEVAERALAELPVEPLHLEWGTSGHQRILRLYIDRRSGQENLGPVGIEDCTRASHALDEVLEAEDPIEFPYTLEVSSPGVDRPLARRRDFESCKGQVVHVESTDAVEGRKRFHGRLQGLRNERISIDVDGKQFEIPLAAVKKARLDFFAGQPADSQAPDEEE